MEKNLRGGKVLCSSPCQAQGLISLNGWWLMYDNRMNSQYIWNMSNTIRQFFMGSPIWLREKDRLLLSLDQNWSIPVGKRKGGCCTVSEHSPLSEMGRRSSSIKWNTKMYFKNQMFPPSPQRTQTVIRINLLITTADPLSRNNINFVLHLEVKTLSQPGLKNNFTTGGLVRKKTLFAYSNRKQPHTAAGVCQINHWCGRGQKDNLSFLLSAANK